MPNDLSVTKHNCLIEASYKLNLNEQRLILACISQLDPRKLLPKDNLFTISAKEFSQAFGIEEKHSYEALEDASKTLYERDIKTYDGRYRERFRWVYYVKYHDNEGKVTMGFSPLVAPYLTMLHKRFTSYKIKQISNLKSVYSIRLFEMLMGFRNTGKLVIKLKKFRAALAIENQYKRFFDFKRWVIEPAVMELKNKSNLTISWEIIKKGQKVESLIFIFKETELAQT